eukprot:CAMPEP_0175338728 /NCGR_PEP_ID=MMETSP0095-20121207/4981_1 /TAXON_ID=311494 /ORGANISM="Alexandrium monilatum, Strain CCMP3105" /LENGTH=179 /DNA_ID=CAMNT_0016636133 /DNA_START=24 /DNA_END=560 /DNA_ORIENTATION=-
MCGGAGSLCDIAGSGGGRPHKAPELTALGTTLSLVDSAVAVVPCDELPTSELIDSISRVLGRLVDTAPPQTGPSHLFDSSTVPSISVASYLQRLQVTFQCCNASFIGALVILDRLLLNCRMHGQEPQHVTPWNFHRLFLTCLVSSVKYNEDDVASTRQYAKAGGVQPRELGCLERFLLG